MENQQLDSLHIHSFRGIQDLELKDLGQINLFVGVNNCGKTSVLEAISLYCNPLNLREWYFISRQRDRESRFFYRLSILDSLTWLFPQGNLTFNQDLDTHKILIQSQGNYPVKQLLADYKIIEGIRIRSNHSKKSGGEDKDDIDNEEFQQGIILDIKVFVNKEEDNNKKEIHKSFELWEEDRITTLEQSKTFKINYFNITPSAHRTEAFAAQLLSEARMQGFKDELIELLQALDSNINNLEVLTFSGVTLHQPPVIYIEHKKLGLVPLSSFGDGVRRLVYIALKLVRLEGGIILIDEIETAIHTEALENSFSWIVKWCKKLDIQLFATTHSLEAVDAILTATEPDTDLVLYRLEQKDSKTSAVRIARDKLKRLRENLGQEVRW
ncbi:AAA ATPase [Rippkaea orientalis PCC 8801]|uniref:AAA ATPase n=1 Tax=Rippkaea orientalis (strain PCC 8801 / RF-1) TaxID=41431 RepID=B7JZN4_RIPO1|nr:ATP-binding protein [Rippkaea orientalis]ACK64977.1 AAA ATPase [Rippkaea orientalis PCC 8801]